MAFNVVNPIKDALLALLESNKAALGLQRTAKDLVLDNLADGGQIEQLVKVFPCAIVNYFGRSGKREGTMLELRLTFAITLAARSVQEPLKSDKIAADLLDPVLALVQGKNLAPALQRDYLSFAGEALLYKDKVFAIYQQTYETTVVVDFRDALKSQ